MPELATMVFTTTGGASLAVEAKARGTGIFMTREGNDQFFPMPVYDEQYAESTNSEGGPRVSSTAKNAVGQGSVVVSGTDQKSFHEHHQRWQLMVEAMRREGGTLAYTPAEGTTVTYDVLSMKGTSAPYDGVKMRAWVQEFQFEFVCRPYGLLSEQDQLLRDHDPFSRNSFAAGEWASPDAGTAPTVANDVASFTTTGENRFYRFGLKYESGSSTIGFISGASVAGALVSLVQKRNSSEQYLYGQLLLNGSSSTLSLKAREAGEVPLKTGSTFTTTANTSYWLRQTISGNVVTLELFTADPDAGAVAVQSINTTLAGGTATKFGANAWGNTGIKIGPSTPVDYQYFDWRADAYAFRATSPLVDLEVPDVPGHVDALGDLRLTDVANQDRRYIDFGLEEAGVYDPTVAPPNIIDSDQMVTSGFSGAQGTRTGAYDPLGSGNTCVTVSLSTFTTVVCSTGPQKHTGPYRIKTRVHLDPLTAGGAVGPGYVRYATSGSTYGPFRRGEWVRVPVTGAWCELDLGVAESPEAVEGEQNWEIRVEAMSETAGDTMNVDYIELLGAARYAKSRGATTYETPTLVLAQDPFNQTGEAAIAGKVAGSAAGEASTKLPAKAKDEGEGTDEWGSEAECTTALAAGGGGIVGSEALNTGNRTKLLVAEKFTMGVPAGATIKGIEVKVYKYDSAGDAKDYEVRVRKAGASVGENKASPSTWPKSAPGSTTTYGGPTDLWGTTWTVEQVNAEGFGAAIRAEAIKNSSYMYVDTITITVWYIPSGGLLWKEFGAKEPKFMLRTGTHLVERNGTGTDEANKGRKMWVPGNFTSQAAQAEVNNVSGVGDLGVMTRYKESPDQRVAAVVSQSGNSYVLQVIKWSGSVATELQTPPGGIRLSKGSGQPVLLRLQVETDGRWMCWADGLMLAQGYDSTLASGELASGAGGVYSECTTGAFVHRVDNFVCWNPEARAATWSGRQMRFRSRDAIKENIEFGTWSRASGYEGARLRLPPAGPSEQTSRIAVRARRADVDESVDEWISDEAQVQLKLVPRVLLLG